MFEESTKPHTEIAVYLENSLENHCALEIFSIFMLNLASEISTFSGELKMRRKSGKQEWGAYDEWTRQSQFITDTINGLVGAAPSLFRDRKTVESMLVPALLKYQLLEDSSASVRRPSTEHSADTTGGSVDQPTGSAGDIEDDVSDL